MPFEPDEEYIRNHLLIDEIIDKLLAGLSEEEFEKSKCPFCQNPLKLSLSPRLNAFFISCSIDAGHFAKHREASRIVEWWKKYVGDGWMICE
jgi:hypothetical protein